MPEEEPGRHLVLCAVCREPLGYIMDPGDPGSHQTSPLGWPKKGALALMQNVLVHVLGEEVHVGRVLEETGLVLGNPEVRELGGLDRLQRPVEALRCRGLEVGQRSG
jgi:hypothetical protein